MHIVRHILAYTILTSLHQPTHAALGIADQAEALIPNQYFEPATTAIQRVTRRCMATYNEFPILCSCIVAGILHTPLLISDPTYATHIVHEIIPDICALYSIHRASLHYNNSLS